MILRSVCVFSRFGFGFFILKVPPNHICQNRYVVFNFWTSWSWEEKVRVKVKVDKKKLRAWNIRNYLILRNGKKVFILHPYLLTPKCANNSIFTLIEVIFFYLKINLQVWRSKEKKLFKMNKYFQEWT